MKRIIHISDTHIGPDKHFKFDGVNTAERLLRSVSFIRQLPYTADLLIHTGDIVETPNPQAYHLAKQILSICDMPLICASGNHDDWKMAYEHFRTPRWIALNPILGVYVYDEADYCVAVVHGAPIPQRNSQGRIAAETLAHLDAFLETSKKPALIATHFPPIQTGIRWVDSFMLLENGEELRRVLENHRAKVLGTIFGHVHLPFSAVRGGLSYFSTAGTSSQVRPNPEDESPVQLDDALPTLNLIEVYGSTIRVEAMVVPHTFDNVHQLMEQLC